MRNAIRCLGPCRERKAAYALLIIIGFFVAASTGFGQIVENPAKPRTANAGRVVVPEEVLAISDEGTSDFYFKWPHGLRPGPDGSLLLADVDQVLWFGGDGRFLGNLFKKGQGPGEMPWPGAPVAAGEAVVIYAASPGKLVYFDPAGRFEKEIAARVEGRSGLTLIAYLPGQFLFDGHEFPRVSGDSGIVDLPRTIYTVGETDGSTATLATFETRSWVVTAGGGGGMFDVTRLLAAPFEGRFLALAHTEDYLIKLYDPAANKVVREFRREYTRVKGEPLTEAERNGGIIINDKHYTRPERKYENDVKNLFTRAGEIWAVTSTKDKAKGVLVDVFDGEGAYRDSFWLKVPDPAQGSFQSPGQCAVDDEFLWVVEKAGDETFAIRKYRIPK
jgi:hypothetical protein